MKESRNSLIVQITDLNMEVKRLKTILRNEQFEVKVMTQYVDETAKELLALRLENIRLRSEDK